MCSLQTLQESLQEEEYCGFAGADTHTACMDGEHCVQSARITSSQVTYISKRWVNRSSNSTLFYTHRLNNLARALCRLLSLKLIGIFVAIKWRRPKHTRHNSSEALKHLLIPPPLFGHYCRIPNLNCQPCARCAAPSQLP